MLDDLEFEGDSLEEALSRASGSLGRAKEELEYEVMQAGRRGFLGVGSRGVRIRVKPPVETAPLPNGSSEAAGAPAGSEAERLDGFLREFTATSPFELEFRITEDSERINIELAGKDRDLFLARRGEGLNALQTVLGRIASRIGTTRTIFLDCGDFRKSREEELAEIAVLTAEKVKKFGEPQSLSPMNPYDRRLVHLALKDDPAVETRSEGEGFLKSVTIFPRQD